MKLIPWLGGWLKGICLDTLSFHGLGPFFLFLSQGKQEKEMSQIICS